MVDAWQLESWEDYRDVMRLGRKTRLAETQRAVLWSIFSQVRDALAERELLTEPCMFRHLERHLAEGTPPPFEFCVIDEAQDIGVAELRFLAVLGCDRPDSLFFAGDLGQRIFRAPPLLARAGRGRARAVAHPVHQLPDFPPDTTAGGSPAAARARRRGRHHRAARRHRLRVQRAGAGRYGISHLRTRRPLPSPTGSTARRQEGFAPHEIAVFVRSGDEIARAREAVRLADLTSTELDERSEGVSDRVVVGTMHLAKGLEFRAVAVMACDDEVLPLQSRIENVADEADLEDTYSTERHLLYVACTRAPRSLACHRRRARVRVPRRSADG